VVVWSSWGGGSLFFKDLNEHLFKEFPLNSQQLNSPSPPLPPPTKLGEISFSKQIPTTIQKRQVG